MYKLFLTVRYLTRKAIVIFPILVVWLCVMMLIIVTSIMGGFVERVQQANRQLLGDIVIDGQGTSWPYYAEFQKELEKMPEVVASTPIIHAAGLITIHGGPRAQSTFARIVGIDPIGRAKVSGFQDTLFRQHNLPLAAAAELAASGLPATTAELQSRAYSAAQKAAAEEDSARSAYFKITAPRKTGVPPSKAEDAALDAYERDAVLSERAQRVLGSAMSLPAAQKFTSLLELQNALVPKEPTFEPPPQALQRFATADVKPQGGCIIGVDLSGGIDGSVASRTPRGEYYRPIDRDYSRADITIVPVTSRGMLSSSPEERTMIIVDDSYSHVFDVDSTYVYAPFEIVQQMANLAGGTREDGQIIRARCSELDIKVAGGDDPLILHAARDAIEQKLREFVANGHEELFGIPVLTWDKKQERYISAVRNEKRMLTFILSLMSLVVLVVIFLIFYMIVRDKTKDIGIIKALGGSEEGVAAIFMMYGLFIGAVGGILGVVGGVTFVWHTNEIHEWIYRFTGVRIWDRSVYLFDEIPHTVNWFEVLTYFAAAMVAGWLGATLPAFFAGRQNPVEAVRYE